MMKIKAIIVEDEKNNADLLAHFIEKYCPTIEVTQIANTKAEAITSIEKEQPDLLFLDIVLDEDTAFDLLEEVNYYAIQIIFVTAFDEYALKAFRYNAVDYLLKPIQIDELIAAVSRVQERLENQEFFTQDQIQNLSHAIVGRSPLKFVAISNIDKVNFVKNEDILYCQSSGRYTEFYLTNKQRLVASKSLGEYEVSLDQSIYFRIHKSYMVNLSHIVNISRKDGNYCELIDGSKLPISRRRMEALIQFLKLM